MKGAALTLILMLFPLMSKADTLKLRNGDVRDGVVSYSLGIFSLVSKNNTQTFPRSNVMSVEFNGLETSPGPPHGGLQGNTGALAVGARPDLVPHEGAAKGGPDSTGWNSLGLGSDTVIFLSGETKKGTLVSIDENTLTLDLGVADPASHNTIKYSRDLILSIMLGNSGGGVGTPSHGSLQLGNKTTKP
jgi:hypothetical protein